MGFALYNTATKLGHIQLVDDRRVEMLIQKYALPGTTIFSDQWPAYCQLQNLGYHHQTVNQSVSQPSPMQDQSVGPPSLMSGQSADADTAECGQPSPMQDQAVGQPSTLQNQSADTAKCGQPSPMQDQSVSPPSPMPGQSADVDTAECGPDRRKCGGKAEVQYGPLRRAAMGFWSVQHCNKTGTYTISGRQTGGDAHTNNTEICTAWNNHLF